MTHLADDFVAINRRLQELQTPQVEITLPSEIIMMIRGDVVDPYKLLNRVVYVLDMNASRITLSLANRLSETKAERSMDELIRTIQPALPSARRILWHIVLSMDDAIKLRRYLRLRV